MYTVLIVTNKTSLTNSVGTNCCSKLNIYNSSFTNALKWYSWFN